MINNLINSLQNLNLQQIIVESLTIHTGTMADLNREQLMEGRDSSDSAMMKYRSSSYAEFKNKMNARAGIFNPDLYLTGETHRSIKYLVTNNEIESQVNDIHELEKKYSTNESNPFMLGNIAKEKLIENHLQKTIIEKLKEKL